MRAPCVIRWPGVIKPGTIFKEMEPIEILEPHPVHAIVAGTHQGRPVTKDKPAQNASAI